MRNMNARWRWRLTYSGFLDTLQRSTIRPYEFSICQNGAWILEPCVNMDMDSAWPAHLGLLLAHLERWLPQSTPVVHELHAWDPFPKVSAHKWARRR